MEPAALDDTTSTTGACIFVAYLLVAVILVSILCRDLINAYIFLPKSLRNQEGLQRHIRAYASLAASSFSVLSYHIIDFLVESYQEWAIEREIELPHRIYGKRGLLGPSHQRTPLYIWTWLRTSTLFQNFARNICEPYENYWWTLQALLMTMACSHLMAQEGLIYWYSKISTGTLTDCETKGPNVRYIIYGFML